MWLLGFGLGTLVQEEFLPPSPGALPGPIAPRSGWVGNAWLGPRAPLGFYSVGIVPGFLFSPRLELSVVDRSALVTQSGGVVTKTDIFYQNKNFLIPGGHFGFDFGLFQAQIGAFGAAWAGTIRSVQTTSSSSGPPTVVQQTQDIVGDMVAIDVSVVVSLAHWNSGPWIVEIGPGMGFLALLETPSPGIPYRQQPFEYGAVLGGALLLEIPLGRGSMISARASIGYFFGDQAAGAVVEFSVGYGMRL